LSVIDVYKKHLVSIVYVLNGHPFIKGRDQHIVHGFSTFKNTIPHGLETGAFGPVGIDFLRSIVIPTIAFRVHTAGVNNRMAVLRYGYRYGATVIPLWMLPAHPGDGVFVIFTIRPL